jgi:acetyl esterase/lipase
LTAPHLLVVAGPGLVADLALVRQLVETERAALDVPGRLVPVADAGELLNVLDDAGRDASCAIVVVQGVDAGARLAMFRPGPHTARTVWYDMADTGPAEPPAGGAVRLAGRGIWGVVWAIRHAVHRLRHPARRFTYGPAADQWGELRLSPGHGGRPLPVAVLLHGGYWRSIWGADLMDGLAIDLAHRGYATWNIEYRRPDRHGWRATTADVAAGIAAVATLAAEEPLDLARVALIGHSAGGQLALNMVADGAGVMLVVSLAGVVDLAEGARRAVGRGAVVATLGGAPGDVAEVYAAADPMARLPLGVPQLIVQGTEDDLDFIDFNRRYVAAARAAGDEVIHIEQPGDHFAVIDPASDIWEAAVARVNQRLRPEANTSAPQPPLG